MGSTLAGLLRVWLRVVDWLPAPSVRMLLLAVLALPLAPAAHADGSYPAKVISQCVANCYLYQSAANRPLLSDPVESCREWATVNYARYIATWGTAPNYQCQVHLSGWASDYFFWLIKWPVAPSTTYSCDYGVEVPGTLSGSQCLCPQNKVPNAEQNACTAPPPSANPNKGEICPAPAMKGNPVFMGTGNKYQREQDYVGPGLLEFTRHYNSVDGGAWSHSWAMRIASTDIAQTVKVVRADGKEYLFTGSGPGAWTSNPTVVERLRQLPAGDSSGATWRLTDANDTVELYNAAGLPMRITYRGGQSLQLQYNGAYLQTVTDDFGRSLQFAYEGQNHLTSLTAPGNLVTRYSWDTQGRLIAVTYPDQRTKQYLYENLSFPNALTGIVDENGNRYATFAYDAEGRAISSEHAGGTQRYQFSYSTSGDATTAVVTEPLGGQMSALFTTVSSRKIYAGQSRLSDQPRGDAAALQVDPATGLIGQSVDFLGVNTLFTWDVSRRLKTSETRAAGRPEAQSTSTQWHPVFRLPTLITEPGRSTAYTYDGLGNQLSQTITDTTTGQSRTWQWSYTPQGLVQTSTDPKGAVWIYGYDSQGNRTSTKNPLGQTTAYAYDAAGRLTQQTDPSGLVTSYVWDARGRVTQISRGGEVSSFSYTPTGQLASATQPDGYQIAYGYDAAQRLVGASDSLGNSTSYTLDAMGNRVREEVKDAGGNIALATTRVINTLNQLAAVQNAKLQTTQLAYDANGRSVSSTDALQHTTRQSLDALGRPTATTFADNASASQSWNQLNQLTGVTDPKGVATGYQRNAFGEVMAEVSPDIGQLSYQRDAAGEVIAKTDARGNTTTVERDALGRPTRIQWASDLTASYTWDTDQAGHLAKVEDASGSTTWQRDAQGRILAKTQQVNDNPASPSQFQLRYGYSGGELASLTYPSGLQVRYQRSQGRITGIELQAPGQAPVPFVSNLTYTALGQPRAWSWSSGDSASRTFDANARMSGNELASYSYDAAGRLTGLSQQLWVNRTLADGTLAPYQTTIGWTAQYDSRDRLVGLQREGSTTQYTYDANGNRLSSQEVSSGAIDLDDRIQRQGYTYTDARQLRIDASSNRLLGQSLTLSASQGNKTVGPSTAENTYTLDAAGNLTQTGLRRYVYDAANRLESVQLYKDSEGAAIHYLHNAQGQRVFKSEVQAQQTAPDEQELGPGFINWLRKSFGWLFTRGNNPNTSLGQAYVYGDGPLPAWALLGEYDNGTAQGKGRTEYIWLPTHDGAIPIGLYRNGQLYSVHSDHLGTPRLVMNAANQPVWQWPYSSFGQNKPTGVLSETVNPTTNQATIKPTRPAQELNLRLPGQYWDEESELAYNYWRSYVAEVGRYMQGDPIGIDGGLNRFSYVEGNPLSYTDPKGLQSMRPYNPFHPDFYKKLNPNPPDLSPEAKCNVVCGFKNQSICTAGTFAMTALTTPLGGAATGAACFIVKTYMCYKKCQGTKQICEPEPMPPIDPNASSDPLPPTF